MYSWSTSDLDIMPWYWVSHCSSTQDLSRQLWSQREFIPALCVQAGMQQHGRGTWGRHWLSAPGNLFLTISCPMQACPALPQLVAAEICSWLQAYGLPAHLKGINDVMLNDAKVCGVLVESWQLPHQAIVAVGVGLNCQSIPAALDQPVTSLAHHGLSLQPELAARQLIPLLMRCLLPQQNWVLPDHPTHLPLCQEDR